MRGVRLERAVLIAGRHHDRGQELLVGRGFDMETADLLIRQQAAVALDAEKEKPAGKLGKAPAEKEKPAPTGEDGDD